MSKIKCKQTNKDVSFENDMHKTVLMPMSIGRRKPRLNPSINSIVALMRVTVSDEQTILHFGGLCIHLMEKIIR